MMKKKYFFISEIFHNLCTIVLFHQYNSNDLCNTMQQFEKFKNVSFTFFKHLEF